LDRLHPSSGRRDVRRKGKGTRGEGWLARAVVTFFKTGKDLSVKGSGKERRVKSNESNEERKKRKTRGAWVSKESVRD